MAFDDFDRAYCSQRSPVEHLPERLIGIIWAGIYFCREELYLRDLVCRSQSLRESLKIQPFVSSIAESAVVEIEAVYVCPNVQREDL